MVRSMSPLISSSYRTAAMTTKNLPPVEYLRKRLRYEPETGKLFWLDCEEMPKDWRTKYAGQEAFTASNARGYRVGAIDNKLFLAHRVIFAICNGYYPIHNIDHINGIKADNRMENMRDVTQLENMKNVSMKRNNTSGYCGVKWHAQRQKWNACIKIFGKTKSLGLFDKIEDAAAARMRAQLANGFTERHGDKLP